jgi:hypothetical protein
MEKLANVSRALIANTSRGVSPAVQLNSPYFRSMDQQGQRETIMDASGKLSVPETSLADKARGALGAGAKGAVGAALMTNVMAAAKGTSASNKTMAIAGGIVGAGATIAKIIADRSKQKHALDVTSRINRVASHTEPEIAADMLMLQGIPSDPVEDPTILQRARQMAGLPV